MPFQTPFAPSLPGLSVQEQQGETAWAAFEHELSRDERLFAQTLPAADVPMPAFVASDLVQLREPVPPPAPRADLAYALDLSQREDRVCPKPDAWQLVFGLLHLMATEAGVEPPPPPMPKRAWVATSRMAKRMAFRDHVEWAARIGQLPRLCALLETFDESRWLHW